MPRSHCDIDGLTVEITANPSTALYGAPYSSGSPATGTGQSVVRVPTFDNRERSTVVKTVLQEFLASSQLPSALIGSKLPLGCGSFEVAAILCGAPAGPL
ncbi:hypothetical protein AAFF_G00206440 [Aldrovandia affinis]|uniref:Uncharacterized protein n=1 Tax=Aldrovandia affinis TaxID=143900 RepID=A0AAD7RHP3_9TELE|nr:hypothetical protein AAFF_G00206440 [Aldrovandia affinis]